MGSELMLTLDVPAHLNPAGVKVRMAGTRQNPLWHLAGLCEALGKTGVSAVQKTGETLEESWLIFLQGAEETPATRPVGRPSKWANAFVTEGGMIYVLTHSNTEAGRKMKVWAFEKVLPTVLRYGCYPAPTNARPRNASESFASAHGAGYAAEELIRQNTTMSASFLVCIMPMPTPAKNKT